MPKILILNGPNLNLLGQREPEIYGYETLKDIEALCLERGSQHGLEIAFIQSNHEGVLIDQMQASRGDCQAMILNAGALTHSSVALLDAVRGIDIPVIEVHLSNPYARESYRRRSYLSPAAYGVICGFGSQSYLLALDAVAKIVMQGESAHSSA